MRLPFSSNYRITFFWYTITISFSLHELECILHQSMADIDTASIRTEISILLTILNWNPCVWRCVKQSFRLSVSAFRSTGALCFHLHSRPSPPAWVTAVLTASNEWRRAPDKHTSLSVGNEGRFHGQPEDQWLFKCECICLKTAASELNAALLKHQLYQQL